MTGLAVLILSIMIGGIFFDVAGSMKANKTNPFSEVGKAGIGILAAKEVFDIITQNNKRGIGSGHNTNPNDSDYGERPY